MTDIQQISAAGFRGAAKTLDDIDLPRIGSRIHVGEDELHAFLEVESRGSGYDDYGRPKALFEPHVFYRLLGAGSKRDLAVSQGLAYPKWGTKKYPLDSYPRIIAACKIEPQAALMATSWGMTQIMGENYKLCKFANVFEMVWAFMQDEATHVNACVDFLIARKLDDDLRAHRWAQLALGYNGTGYKKNKYDTKLAAAFKKWQAIPDTPYDNLRDYLVEKNDVKDPNAVFTIDVTKARLEAEDLEPIKDDLEAFVSPKPKMINGKWPEQLLKDYEVEAVQKRLRELGYMLKVDKKWGKETKAQIIKLQATAGIEEDGHYGPDVAEALADDRNRYQVSEARKNTTKDDLRAQGSRIIAGADAVKSTGKLGAVGTAVTGGVLGLYDTAPQALSWISPLKDFFTEIPWWIWIIVGLIICFVLIKSGNKISDARLQDEQSGKTIGHPDPSPSPPITVTDGTEDLGSKMPKFLKTRERAKQIVAGRKGAR